MGLLVEAALDQGEGVGLVDGRIDGEGGGEGGRAVEGGGGRTRGGGVSVGVCGRVGVGSAAVAVDDPGPTWFNCVVCSIPDLFRCDSAGN